MPGYCLIMPVHAIKIGFIISVILISDGMAYADSYIQNCTKTGPQNNQDVNMEFCFMSKQNVQLFCPPKSLIVIKSLKLAVKKLQESCMQRVLNPDLRFCCSAQPIDVLYDTQCLRGIWNREDREHYKTFVMGTLSQCMGKSQCNLSSDIFANLQRKIPTLDDYSSYLQVTYQCVKVPEEPVSFCSSISRIDKDINFRGTVASSTNNLTCTCTVTSPHGGNISVKAVDVRPTYHNSNMSKDFYLNIKQSSDKNITGDDLPLFGFKEIFSDKGINISLKLTSKTASENLKLWLHVSGSDGKDVNVTCRESTTEVKGVTAVTGQVSRNTQETALGFWPLLFGAIGAIVACFFLVLLFGVVWICRNRLKKKRQKPTSSLPTTQTFLPDTNYDPPYATVLDQTPEHRPSRVARSVSSQTLQRSYSKPYPKPYPRSTSMRSLRDRPPTAPPPPPPNHPVLGRSLYNQPYSRFNRLDGYSCDVQQLEAFLEGREPSVPMEVESIHGSMCDPEYASPKLMSIKPRLQSELSYRSYFKGGHCFDSVPRSEVDSVHCFGSVFECEGSVHDSLLENGDTLHIAHRRDLLGDTEINQSLLLDHKEDENHNEFENRVRPVMTRM